MAVQAGIADQSGIRYRISRAIFVRREFLFSVFYGVAFGGILYLFGSSFLSDQPIIPIAVAGVTALVCFWNLFIGTGLGLTGAAVMALYANNPMVAWFLLVAGLLTFFAIYVWRAYLALLMVAGAPILLQIGAGPIVPVVLGLGLGKKIGPLITAVAFAFAVIAACYTGNEGLYLSEGVATLKVAQEAIPGQAWYRSILTAPDFTGVVALISDKLSDIGPGFGVILLAWLVAAFLAGMIKEERGFKDDLATEYLKRVGDAKAKRQTFFRSAGMAALIAGIVAIAGYAALPLILPELAMDPAFAGRGALAVLGVILAVWMQYKGDPRDAAVGKGVSGTAAKPALIKPSKDKKPSQMFSRDPRATGAEANAASDRVAAIQASAPKAPRTTPGPGMSKAGDSNADLSLSALRKKSGFEPEPSAKSSKGDEAKTEAQPAGEKGVTEFKVQGKIDGQYSINKIRSGGMGVVYIVTDDFSGKRYAVKSLKDEYLQNEEAMKRFEVEAKTWINLDQHQNIVQAMLFRVIQGRPLLFLEYIDGTDLDKILNMHKDFELTKVLDWAIQVCRGMAYAHTKDVGADQTGIIHRDLKPANLMLTRNGVIKITDFGLAKVASGTSGLTRSDTGIGTPYYMPPEQIDDARSVDKRADIYSFGAVLYELVTGRPPFQGDSISNLYMQISSKDPIPPSRVNPDIPEGLDRIVMRCLEKRKENRPTSFEEVEDELQAIAAAMPAGTTRGDARAAATGSGATTRPVSSGRISSERLQRTSDGATAGEVLIEAIMFIDMAGSTDRGEIGDQLVFELKETLDSFVRPQCEKRNCKFLKGTGDGFMVTFQTSADAVNSAKDIMRKVQGHNSKAAKLRKIDIRIGINFGEVRLTSDGDRVGQTVNMAARVEGVKSKDLHETKLGVTQSDFHEVNRILVSEKVFNEIKSLEDMATQLLGYFDLKGFTGRHPIYEVKWE